MNILESKLMLKCIEKLLDAAQSALGEYLQRNIPDNFDTSKRF